MATATKKPKTKKKSKGVTIGQLTKTVAKSPKGDTLIKTAIETGYFSDGRLVTVMTAHESKKIKQDYGRTAEVKKAKIDKRVAALLKVEEGPALEVVGVHDEKSLSGETLIAMKTKGGSPVFLTEADYHTLLTRHPKASWYAQGFEAAEYQNKPLFLRLEPTTDPTPLAIIMPTAPATEEQRKEYADSQKAATEAAAPAKPAKGGKGKGKAKGKGKKKAEDAAPPPEVPPTDAPVPEPTAASQETPPEVPPAPVEMPAQS